MASPNELASVIQGAQRREQAAFERLVDLYSHRLYGFLYRLTSRREEAEDLVQEVFVRVVRTIGDYRDDGRFEGWLFKIATNLARDRMRRIRRMAETVSLVSVPDTHLDRRVGPNSSGPENGGLAERTMAAADEADRLQRAIAGLPEAQREVILLRHYAGMSFPEIAEMMGTPLGTALARAHRGLANLRECMGSAE
jgi:RNA polymerase sigma-70 factor (ECF subfamily)